MIRGAVLLAALVSMVWSPSARTIVVAHDGRIEGFDATGEKRLWSVEGVATPTAIAASRDGKSVAVVDGFADRIAVVSLADGAVAMHEMAGTPVAAAFFQRDLWVALRDRSSVVRIAPDGKRTEVAVALDPAVIAVDERLVYVWSRVSGVLQKLDPRSAQITGRLDRTTYGKPATLGEEPLQADGGRFVWDAKSGRPLKVKG